MKDKSMKRPSSAFRKGFLIYLSVLALLLVAALITLWVLLARFQAGKDAEAAALAEKEAQAAHELAVERAPQLAFEEFLAGTTPEYWAEQWFDARPGSFDDGERVTEKMGELFFGEGFGCWKATEYTDSVPVYILKNNGEELATVTLAGSELDWSVSEVDMLLEGSEEASVEVPADCVVYCNGTVLDETYTHDDVSYFELEEYADKLENPILWTTYTVSGQLFAPTLTAEAPADRSLVTAEDGSCSYVLSAADSKDFQSEAEDFVETLLFYYMQGANNTQGNMWSALNCVAKNSQAYQLIYDSYNGVTWDTPYPNATYETKAGEVTIWADNCVSLDVSYHSEGSAQGYTNVADGTYRIYFLDLGDGFGIYGLSSV